MPRNYVKEPKVDGPALLELLRPELDIYGVRVSAARCRFSERRLNHWIGQMREGQGVPLEVADMLVQRLLGDPGALHRLTDGAL